jgi:hypothetical protein
MKTVAKIIDLFGGIAKMPPIELHVEGYMRLCIENVGINLCCGPRGGALISVAHYYEQNGDLMRDPDLVFEIIDGEWWPISYRQDNLGLFQEAVWCDDSSRVMVRQKLVRDLKSFARQWDRNLKEQGFLAAAERAKRS